MNAFDRFFCSFFPKPEIGATETGLGATGIPRAGKPKTEAERLSTHIRRYGSKELPERGTGLTK